MCGAFSSITMKNTPTIVSAMPAASEMPGRSPLSRSLGTLRIAIGMNAIMPSVAMPEKRRRSKQRVAVKPPRISGSRPASPPSRIALPSSEPTIASLTTSGRLARSARMVIASSATLPKPDCTMPTTLG